jgi:hypothetical protein
MPGPIPRRAAMVLMLGLAALAGCGEKEEEDKNLDRVIVKIDDVPPKVMETAKKEWPGVTFTDAWTNHERGQGKEKVHSYEVRGKDPQTGKVREVRVSIDGSQVLEKEG